MIKRLLIAIVLLAIVAGGVVGFNIFRDQAIEDFFANMPASNVTVSTVTVETGEWMPAIEAIGTVHASRGVDLTVEATGIITSVDFTANQQVAKNDVLLQIDDKVQQADLEAQRTQAALDRQSLERARELRERGVGSSVSLDTAQAAAQASAAQVEKLEAVLQQRQLRAPFAGTIGIPRVEEGQYLTPGTTVATLQDLDTMRADFTVPEQQFGRLRIGQPVRLVFDDRDVVYNGEITGIDPKVNPSSRLVSVRAEIDNTDGRLTPGQFVQVRVDLPKEENVISLPQTAVVTSLYGDHVFVVRGAGEAAENGGEGSEDGQAESGAAGGGEAGEKLEVRQVFVDVGRRSGDQVEIRSGLEPGDVVVTAGQNRLSNGTPVVVDNTVNPADARRTPADNPEEATDEEEAAEADAQ